MHNAFQFNDFVSTFVHLAKDSWVVSGMMDYYSNTNSVRIVDVLVKVQTPHDNYIFDKLFEWVNSAKRNQAFNLFWLIVKKHPSWLHKVATHPLFREMLKVLKVCTTLVEIDVLNCKSNTQLYLFCFLLSII